MPCITPTPCVPFSSNAFATVPYVLGRLVDVCPSTATCKSSTRPCNTCDTSDSAIKALREKAECVSGKILVASFEYGARLQPNQVTLYDRRALLISLLARALECPGKRCDVVPLLTSQLAGCRPILADIDALDSAAAAELAANVVVITQQGPRGFIGSQGPPGPPGPPSIVPGPAGAPGLTWLVGSGPPGSGVGVLGDLYLDQSNGDFYNKTSGTVWTLLGSLAGPTGSVGPPGSQILAGASAPPGGLGVVGDFYIRTSNGEYFLKTGVSTWTSQGTLSGPAGPAGPAGSAGAAGAAGSQILTGASAPPGGLGVVGDFYIRTSNGEYFLKTGVSTWTSQGNLTGTTGAPGSQIFSGAGIPPAALGVPGDFYFDTATGIYYQKTGPTLWTAQGNLTGPAGANGAPGSVILTGSGAPLSGLGVAGDFYIDNVTGNYYIKTDAVTWVLQGTLVGAVGPAGPENPIPYYYTMN